VILSANVFAASFREVGLKAPELKIMDNLSDPWIQAFRDLNPDKDLGIARGMGMFLVFRPEAEQTYAVPRWKKPPEAMQLLLSFLEDPEFGDETMWGSNGIREVAYAVLDVALQKGSLLYSDTEEYQKLQAWVQSKSEPQLLSPRSSRFKKSLVNKQ
jgi:hypothetical protein